MAKDPAFLFYPGDWLGGTMGMTLEEKGAYIELLMMQFTRGHMTEHMIHRMIGQLWDNIKDKFEQDENGLWFNSRLDEEKVKRKKYVESRRNNKKGANQHTKRKKTKPIGLGHMTEHMTTHMENENENENRSLSLKGVPEFFEKFWTAYNRKIKRPNAERAFVEAIKDNGADPVSVIESASIYARYCAKFGRKQQDPARWLQDKAYETDWLEIAKQDRQAEKGKEKSRDLMDAAAKHKAEMDEYWKNENK